MFTPYFHMLSPRDVLCPHLILMGGCSMPFPLLHLPGRYEGSTKQASLQTALTVPEVSLTAPPGCSGSSFIRFGWCCKGAMCEGKCFVLWDVPHTLGAPKCWAPPSSSWGNNTCSDSLKHSKYDLASPGPGVCLQVMGWGGCRGWDMPLSPSGKCAMLKDFPVHGEQALGHSSCRSLVPGAGVRAVPKAAQHFTK